MDITLAKTYLAVVETGSFFEAGHRINVTQSTISARIKSLEELVGKTLFERSRAGASLTLAGAQFHKHALALVRIWEHARLEVGMSEDHKDHLSIGGQVSLWDGFLLPWIALLRKNQPEIAVSASMGFSSVLMERLAEGSLDLAVMYRPVQRPGLVIEHLFDEELVLVTSGDATIRRPDESYLFVNWGPEFQADHALAYPNLSHPGLYLDLGSLAINYLMEKKASGYFPIRIAQPHFDSGLLAYAKRAPRFVYPVYAVYPEARDEEAYLPILEELRAIAAQI